MKFIESLPKFTFTAASSTLLAAGIFLAGPGTAAADTVQKSDCSGDRCAPVVTATGIDANQSAADTLNQELGSDMAGYMTAEHVSHAREVVDAAKDRDLGKRAATIAIATVIVETHLNNYPGGDRDSVGLFQQRDHYGSHEERLDPTWAANAFYDELEFVYPDGSWDDEPIGDVSQDVQRSAYPYRYGYQADDAGTIVDHLW